MSLAESGLAVGPVGRREPYPAAETAVHLIEQAAQRHPDAQAVSYDGSVLTYRELDGRANRLAHRLLAAGAAPGALLPLLIDDGLELPLSLVAAMKAAVPFLPFDAGWPQERIDTLLREVGATLVLASPRTAQSVTARYRALIVDAAELDEAPAAPPRRPARTDLAYGFFTSGTTGAPKCTLNLHGGLLNRLAYMTRHFGPGPVSLQNSRSTFDSSLWQLLWPLTSDGRVVMPRRDGLLDLESTVRQIGASGVTVTDYVPSIFSVLVDMLAADRALLAAAGSLRHVLIGGEAINVEAVRRFHELLPEVRVTNTYGPTEASIGSVFHTLDGAPGAEIPLGRPIDNTLALVVDDELRMLGPGETGEILIGGDCLGAGYLNDPQRTAAAFIDNPFPELPGDRLYRTGDLGHYREDGLLYFVGRRDDQLKVRGVRIEPAELERSLSALPGVQDVKVLALAEAEQTTLIAAVVAAGDFDPAAARAAARGLLPGEFVPDRFVAVDRIPLSANGKADRGRLARQVADMLEERRGTAADGAAADTPDGESALDGHELALLGLWDRAVGCGPVAAQDGFFDVGGTSLSAHRLAVLIRERFGVRIPTRDLIGASTLRAQARLIHAAVGTVAGGGPAAGIDALTARRMAEEARLPDWFEVPGEQAHGTPARILLTGATGFVGVHLLEELLRGSGATVVCLVYASDQDDARARLAARALRYGCDLDAHADRVVVLPGDLAAPLLGLAPDTFAALADSLDAIVHAGAEVNLLHPYERLAPANVAGTREILRLASTGRLKRIHHVSTLSILAAPALDPGAANGAVPDEGSFPAVAAVPAGGYHQTKWTAEALLRAARAGGAPVSIYRLGDVMPHSRRGVFSHGGSLPEYLLRVAAELGLWSRTAAVGDFTPVDNVSRFIAAAVLDGEPRDCLHVVQPQPVRLDDLLSHFAGRFGLREVPYAEFCRQVAERCADAPADSVLRQLDTILPDGGDSSAVRADEAALREFFQQPTDPGFSAQCRERSERLGVRWVPVDEEVFESYARTVQGR